MSDELERMKQAFRDQEPIRPEAAVRETALQAAMEGFQKANERVRQGSGIGVRLKGRVYALRTALKRKPTMNLTRPKLSYLLASGVSLAVVAFITVNFSQIVERLHVDYGYGEKIEHARAPADQEDVFGAFGGGSASSPAEVQRMSEASPEPLARGAAVSSTAIQGPGQALAPAPMGSRMEAKQARGLADRSDIVAPGYQDQGRDKFEDITPNPLKLVTEDPVSTFSVDVDTASYAFVRGALNRGVLPQKDAVRVEELINYFDYNYETPDSRDEPFQANISVMPSPWNVNTKLLRVGIKGFELPASERPKANLVFLIDTSGSMESPDKLPLLRNSFKLLLSSLQADDTVAIVTYAGSAGTVLEPTRAEDKNKILSALDRLHAGGSTAGAEGIRQAYQLAERQMEEGGVNRVILATDGDFNVGISDVEELKGFVERKRKTGVTLSVLGFGHGNYNDQLMQALAQNGNGNAAYIDTLNEARKVLVEQAGATLFTIAKDVKLQLEFNPAMVSEYRLIGYETRMLNREDFNNDKVDAGDIGAGHSVTALYEFTPAGSAARQIDPLRYQAEAEPKASGRDGEYGFLKIRYKLPESDSSTLISTAVETSQEVPSAEQAPQSARFAAAVAAFGQILRGGRYTGDFTYDDVIALAQSAKGEDPFGYRNEFVNLVRLAKAAAALEPQQR